MVLVSNEWQSNKDDEQKPGAAAAATTTISTSPAAAAAAAAVTTALNNGTASVTSATAEQELTARPVNVSNVGELSKRQQRLNKKAHLMEQSKKSQQDPLQQQQQQQQMREKHETETCEQPREDNSNTNRINSNSINSSLCSNDANENLENQENNNTTVTEVCDSNTNTLLQGQLATKQAQLQLAMNSVLNANNPTTGGNLFSSMGALQLPNEPSNTLINTNNTQDLSPGEARIVLQCELKSHKFETRNISLAPGQECKVGRLIAKSKASENNAIFDCKVLSRNHAMLWYDGRFWVKDTKSSNGTFINDNKLGNEPAELHSGDTVKFGVEVIENSRQEVHGCIIARVTLYLPDGREAISIDSEQLQMTGPNRISYDEILRLNAFLQEASQREKMLKAKLSNLQGVLDATRKNSAMCWQSMITEDQLLHKINLLEKKLQMMEKNVPENTLRNEVVKLLEDKSSYQLTAKEALRKVYQDRCDAMQMLSKMEMAYTTSDNECTILRTLILSSNQTVQNCNVRLEQLQKEYTEYQQETQRQLQEAKEQEERKHKELLVAQESEMDQMRQQLMQLQQKIAEHDSEHALQQQQTLEQLNEAIGGDFDDDDDDDDDDEDDNDNEDDDIDHDADTESEREKKEAGDHDIDATKKDEGQVNKGPKSDEPSDLHNKKEDQMTPSKRKSYKKTKRLQLEEFDLKNKVIRKGTMMKLLKNSDLKGADSGDVLKAIFNAADSGDEDHELKLDSPEASPTESSFAEAACDEFIHKSPKHSRLNGIEETTEGLSVSPPKAIHKLVTQDTLVRHDGFNEEDLPQVHAMDMLHEECLFYKRKSDKLTNDISFLEDEVKKLKDQLQKQLPSAETGGVDGMEKTENEKEPLLPAADKDLDSDLASWREDVSIMNDVQVEREEELIVYKERLEKSEMSNLELRKEISELRLKQPMLGKDQHLFYRRALPLGCVALAAIIYYLSIHF